MNGKKSAITIKKFVEALLAGGGANPSPASCVEYALQHGWLEMQDVAKQEELLLRKHAARIIHNFLRLELKETDEIDGSPAYVLQDLFDCRVCAGHIIQMYVKGIMGGIALPDDRMIFNADEVVPEKEAEKFIIRAVQPEERIKADVSNTMGREPEEISIEQVIQLMQEKKNICLVDVRSEREYEERHLEGAVNIPLLTIIKNPFVLSENRDTMILLYCAEGYQSKAAAGCLLEAGYSKVAYFAWK